MYTIVNFIDKYIVTKEVKDYRGMPIYGTIMGLIMGSIFFVATGFPVLPLRDTLLLLLSGCLIIWSAAVYFKAISADDASKIILLFQMTPLMVLLMSYIFLGESISAWQVVGFFLIFASIIGVSDDAHMRGFQLTKTFWLILLVTFMWALSAILVSFTISANSFAEVLSYESWGLGLGGLMLYVFFPQIRNAFNKSIREIRKVILGVMFANEGVFVAGKTMTFFAYSLGPTSLVSVLGGTQVFIGIIYGLILTLFFPHIVKEDISRKMLSRKLVFSLILFCGLILVSVNG